MPKSVADFNTGRRTSAGSGANDPISSFTPKQTQTATEKQKKKKKDELQAARLQRAQAVIGNMGSGVGGGMGIGVSGKRNTEIAELSDNISTLKQQLRSVKAQQSKDKTTNSFLGESASAFVIPTAKQYREETARREKERAQKAEQAQKRYEEEFPTKYANYDKKQTDAALKQLKQGGEKTAQEYEWLKADQYYHWTKDELKQGIKANEKRMVELEASMSNADAVERAKYGAEHREAENADNAMRTALETMAYAEEFAKMPEELADEIIDAAGEYQLRGAYKGAGEDIGGVNVGSEDRANTGEEYREKMNKLTEELANRGYSKDQINGFFDYAERAYNARKAKEQQEGFKESADVGGKKQAMSAASVVANTVGGGIGSLDLAMQRLTNGVDPFTGERRSIDFNSAAQRLANASREMRSARSEGMDSTASFLYNTGMSIADFFLASRFGNVGAQVILGSSAAQSAAQEAHMRGASDDQALLVGLTSGLAEAVFESISLEKLGALEKAVDVVRKGGTRLTAKEVAKAIGVQSFTEGSEEFFTTLANTLTDALIMGDKSELNSNIKRLMMDEGLSKDEATREAWTDWFENIALDFAGGALSGGLIGSFEGGRVAGNQAMWNRRIGNAETAAQNVNNLRAAMNMPRNGASRAVADNVIAKLAKGGIPTKSEMGKLAYALEEDARNGVEVGTTADSDYEISLGEDGKINVVMKLGPLAEELQASGMTAKDAIASGNALETLVSGGKLSGKQIKKLAKEEAVRKAFTRMTGKELPENGKLTEMADAMESAAAEYRAEQDAIEQQRAKDEAELAEQGKELEEVQELYDEVSAEIEQSAQAQAAEEMNNAVAEAKQQQQTQAEQQTDAEPALSKEQYIEQYRREQREKRGFVTTPEQEEAAWNRYVEKDGIKLDNGEVIPRSRFFEEVREYYSNLAEDPIDLTDEQLDEYYMARRAASRAKPEAAAAWSNGAEAQTAQAESAVTESTASEPVGANNAQTEAVNGATISKNETVAPATEQNAARVVEKKNAAKAEQRSQSRQSVVNDDVDISDDELRSEGVESSPNVSREQLVTMLYLKPYLDRMGIKNVRFVGNEIGDAEASIDGDTININENHATTAGVIARVIGHEILHPATSQTRRERGDENNSLAEDVINLMKDYADKGLLHGVDGDKIKYQIEHFDETLKERTERYANYYRNEGYSEAEIAEKTAEHLMREEIAADWMGYALRNTNILEKLAGIKSNPLARVLDAIDRIRGMEINHLLKTDSKEYRDAIKALEDLAKNTHTALDNAAKERGGSGGTEQTDSERYSVRSVYAAAGLNAKLEDGLVKVYDKNGNAVSKVTTKMVNESSLGAMINLAATGIEQRDKNGNVKFFSPPTISVKDAKKQIEAATELLNMMLDAQDGALVWNFAGATLFSAVKTNSDGQYSITIDFSTVCRKTRNMMRAMSEAMVKLGRGLTKEEVIEIQNDVVSEGGEVNCPVCYVFSRWAGIGGILENMKQFQEKYGREYDDDAKLDAAIKDLEQKLKNKKDLRAALLQHDTQYQDLTRDVENINGELKELRKRKKEVAKAAKKDESAANELAKIDAAINGKIKDRDSAQKELKKLEADSTPELAWLKRVRAVQDENGNWKSNPEYWHGGFVGTEDESGKYTTDVKTLFNLEDAATFVEKYPLAWSYRTSRGPAAGKAILPYSDMVLGDFILGPKSGANTGNTDFADTTSGEFNKTQMGKIQSAIRRVLAQNLIGGQRFQSTSDFRFDYGLDYLMAFWELQAVGGTMQSYTKVPDFVHLAAAVGGDVNISMMPRDSGVDENGKLIYSDVTGVDPDEAYKLNELYDSAQLILVGINDQHIAAALEDNTGSGGAQIGFVIPYHASGASINEYISKLLQNLGEEFQTEYYKDYSKLQTDSDKKIPNATDVQVKTWLDAMKRNPSNPEFGTDKPNAEQLAMLNRRLRSEIRTALLTGKTSFLNEDGTKGNANEANANAFIEDALPLFDGKSKDISRMSFERLSEIERRALAGDPDAIKEYESWSAGILWDIYQKMWVDESAYNTYDVRLTSQQAHAIMPHEYWNKKVNRDKAYVNGFIFRSYCHSLGMYPRFSGYTSSGQYLDYGDFTSTASGISEDAQRGYWKLLIDRPMYDNNGRYREQNRINATDVLKITEEGVLDADLIGRKDETLSNNEAAVRAANKFVERHQDETAKYSVPSTGETENAIYIKDGKKADGTTVDFISAILDGVKKGETRTHKRLTRKWVGIAKDGKVYGRVRLGNPILLKRGTQEYNDSLIEGTEYDLKPGETKYYYPVLEIEDFRSNPVPILQNGNYGKYQRSNPVSAFKPVAQKHTSRGTSINTKKLPKLYSSVSFKPGTVNIDIGAGVEDTPATKYLAEQGVESLPFDPFNRTKETNTRVTDFLQSGEKSDTATCSNVLNVIDNADARANVILQMAKAIKPDGEAYFTVYSNKDNLDAGKAGEVKSKPDQWQEFRAAQTYIPEIEQYFDDVSQPKNGVIVAKKPKKNLPAAMWQIASTEYRDKSGNQIYDKDEAVRYSIPGENDLFDEYIKKMEEEMRQKYLQDHPPVHRESQTNSTNPLLTDEEKAKTGREKGDIVHTVVTDEGMADMVAARLSDEEKIAKEKRTLFRKGKKWTAADLAVAEELIKREVDRARETDDFDEAKRLLKMHDAQMSDWGLAGHTAREFSRTIASIINDATNIIDAAAEHQAVNKQKKKTGKQVEKGASEAGKEALGKIREEIGNAVGERPRTANAFKTKKENAQSKGGKNAVDSNMVNEPFTFEYADAVGTALANSIVKRGEQRQQAKTFLKQIQEEMMRFANERLPARKNKTKPTVATELLKSFVDNRKFFDRAWELASDELRRKYGDNIPGGVQAFMRGWYGLSDGALSSNIMKAAIVSSAVATEETANLIRKQAAAGSRDIGKVIADDLIEKTGASGELADMIRAAADAYVEDIVGRQEAGSTAKKRDYLINSALREIGKAIDAKAGPTSMGRLGSTSAASKAVVRDAVINTLINKYAATEADAERVADVIGNRFDELLREGMKQRLDTIFKDRGDVTPKKQKAFLDRLIELTNLGAMESSDYHDAAVSKLLDGYETRRGVSTDKVLREIYDYASKLESVPKGDIKNLKAMVAELNAKRWTGGLRKGDEIHKTLQKAIDTVASEPGGEEFLRDLIAAQIRGIANDNSKITGVERASAVRYLSMLSKLTTVMRNLIGNTSFDLVDSVSQDVSVPLDILLSQFTKRRTTTVDKSLLSKAKREGMVAAATRAYIETALDAPIEDGTNRWEMRDGRTFKMAKREDANALQKAGNAVERYFSTMEKWQRYLLTVSDEFYKGGTREERQRQIDWLKSKGLLEEDALTDEAQQLALERTFQNNDLMAQLVDLPRRGLDLIGFKDYKGNRFGLGKAIMPFARVPANLVGQIFNYSPAGLAKGVAEAIIVAKNGKNATAEQQAKAVRDLGRGMNGTTLIGLLTIAAMRGLLSVAGAGSGDDDEKALERDMGKTGTQLNLSALQRWMNGESTEWQDGDVLMSVGGIEPLNGPMAFAGLLAASAESNSSVAARIANGNFQTAMQALSELPAMSTINNMINAYKYSDEKYDEETNPNGGPWKQFADAAAQFGGDVASSFMPNVISGIAQGLDEGKVRTTQTSDKRGIEAVPEEVLNSFKMKTPGLRSTLPQALDSFGQERQTTAGKTQNWLNSNIMPLAITSFRPNEVSQELINLRKEGAKITMPPRNAPKTVGSEDDKKRLTEAERREYQKTVGASELETMTDAIGNTDYQNASASTRAQVWANLKSYATAEGKQAVGVDAETPNWAGKYEGTIADKAITAAYFTKAKKDAGLDSNPTNAELIEAVTSSNMSSSMQNVVLRDNLSEAGYKKYVGAKNVGLSAQAYVLLLGETSDDRMPADKDKNGKTISGSRKEKVVAYLRELQNYGLLNEEQVKYFITDVYGWKY